MSLFDRSLSRSGEVRTSALVNDPDIAIDNQRPAFANVELGP